MHDMAMLHGRLFFETYVTAPASILDVGSQDVNGSLRSVAPKGCKYTGVDFASGRGVDVIITDPYSLPFGGEEFDVVVTSSCFEHSEFFWLTFLEALRILKPTGLLYINVPSNGPFHRYPVDCWRFYPDSGFALQNWARRNGVNAALLESFTGAQGAGVWNDFVAVFVKDATAAVQFPRRMIDSELDFANGMVADDHILKERIWPQDQSTFLQRIRRRLRPPR